MSIANKIEFANVSDLYLDPKNPRLGRRITGRPASQGQILTWMREEGVLEELAVSFLESGFWPQEAVVVVEERIGKTGPKRMVVVEGNRRLATLKLLWSARNGDPASAKWHRLATNATKAQMDRLEVVPYLLAQSRAEVQAYLGFRHVSGIKEWNPAEKAEFISHLIDEGKTYEQVMRLIGSKTTTVRQNYLAYRLLRQMESESDDIDVDKVEDRFSVLYLALRTEGVKQFLGINASAGPKEAARPVPDSKMSNLADFSLWLFGKGETDPLVKDSRQTDQFARILQNQDAVDYLRRSPSPRFEVAYRHAGGVEEETAAHLERAADELREALATVHLYRKSLRIKESVERLGRDALELLDRFPEIKERVEAQD